MPNVVAGDAGSSQGNDNGWPLSRPLLLAQLKALCWFYTQPLSLFTTVAATTPTYYCGGVTDYHASQVCTPFLLVVWVVQVSPRNPLVKQSIAAASAPAGQVITPTPLLDMLGARMAAVLYYASALLVEQVGLGPCTGPYILPMRSRQEDHCILQDVASIAHVIL